MFRKIILIFITVFLLSSNSIKALLALIILYTSLYFQRKFNPFNIDELNRMEFRSSMASIFTLYFGLLNYLVESRTSKIILFLGVSFVNTYFLVHWTFKMILLNFSKWHFCIKYILKRFFPEYLAEYKKFFNLSKYILNYNVKDFFYLEIKPVLHKNNDKCIQNSKSKNFRKKIAIKWTEKKKRILFQK